MTRSVQGRPKRIRVDNGPEFISKELDLWAYLNGVELDFSRPGLAGKGGSGHLPMRDLIQWLSDRVG